MKMATVVAVEASSAPQTPGGGRRPERQGDDSTSEEGSVSQKRIEANVSIAEFRIENGTVVSRIEEPSPAETTITGLNLRLKEFRLDSSAAEPILGLSGKGSIEVDRIITDDLQLEGSHGRIEIDRGRVSISDLGVKTRNASLEVSALGLNLRREPPPFNLQAGGEYDLNAFVEEGGTRTFGPASLQMSLSGEAPSVDQINGDGTLRLESGEIPAFPMVTLIEHILGENLITGSRYQATDIAFTVENGRIHVQPFVLPVEDMQISGLGTIEMNGPLDLEVSVRLPRDRVDIEALEGAIDGLTEDGYTTLPFNVTGTAGDPEVTIDSSLYKDAMKGMGKKALGGLLDRVFDNDDSN